MNHTAPTKQHHFTPSQFSGDDRLLVLSKGVGRYKAGYIDERTLALIDLNIDKAVKGTVRLFGSAETLCSTLNLEGYQVVTPPPTNEEREVNAVRHYLECLDVGFAGPPPDYFNDVTALHRVWKSLGYNRQAAFSHHLSRVIFGRSMADGMLMGEHDLSRVANATALQRVVALVLTLLDVEVTPTPHFQVSDEDRQLLTCFVSRHNPKLVDGPSLLDNEVPDYVHHRATTTAELVTALQNMCKEFREADLPHGSPAYLAANHLLNRVVLK